MSYSMQDLTVRLATMPGDAVRVALAQVGWEFKAGAGGVVAKAPAIDPSFVPTFIFAIQGAMGGDVLDVHVGDTPHE